MCARFGSIELAAFLNYLQVNHKLPEKDCFELPGYLLGEKIPYWYSIGTKRGLCNNAGFFPYPPSDDMLQKWGCLVEKDLKEVDVLLRWLKMEDSVLNMNMNMNFLPYKNIELPFCFKNPYIEALRGKKVLVISPFSNSIRSQFLRLRDVWRDYNPKMAPEYELITFQSYNVLRGNETIPNINTWFDALSDMKDRIQMMDFDIALIGCGAYAFHLAAHVKRMGKKSITTCGATQLLYGIYGNRWADWLESKKIRNEFWIHPFDAKPYGYEKVENSAYW